MDLSFTKMEGLGNDFIMVDDRKQGIAKIEGYNDIAKKLCDRRFGIGADGLIIVLDSLTCDIQFRVFNSDGSEAQMCGNGMRCLARYVYESGMIEKTELTVETLAGVIIPKLNIDDQGKIRSVTVDMGQPILDAEKIPFKPSLPGALVQTIATDNGPVSFTAVSMGNPHAIIFVDDASTAPLLETGPLVETHPSFPQKTNVEFIQVLSDSELRMKVWERGAGVTLACGTGACAAVVAAILNGKTKNTVIVHLDGGDLEITWDKGSGHVFKTGPARSVFQGRIQI
jgi:diaminopimelate epimerase